MTLYLNTQADLDRAIKTLVARDPRLTAIVDATGLPALRRREGGFAGLAAIICGQQLSISAAAAIWGRVSARFDPFHHDLIRKARTDHLGRLGLSAAKIKSLKAIAAELGAARLDLDRIAEQDADVAHGMLTALHGVGPWTASIYLLFCLGHSDAWPAGDIALQEAMRVGLGLTTRPPPKEAEQFAETWRPLRGAAAHLWWAYYHLLKKRESVPTFGSVADSAENAKSRTSKPIPATASSRAGRRMPKKPRNTGADDS